MRRERCPLAMQFGGSQRISVLSASRLCRLDYPEHLAHRYPIRLAARQPTGQDAKLTRGVAVLVSKRLETEESDRPHERRQRRTRLGQRAQGVEDGRLGVGHAANYAGPTPRN